VSFQQILSEANGTFESVKITLATSDKPSGLDDAELEMFGAVDRQDCTRDIARERAGLDTDNIRLGCRHARHLR
jgi:hypothetical protein